MAEAGLDAAGLAVAELTEVRAAGEVADAAVGAELEHAASVAMRQAAMAEAVQAETFMVTSSR